MGARSKTAVKPAKPKERFWQYFIRHWQLYILFLGPAFVLTILFRYVPMGGILIAFVDYNPFKGIMGSEWVGLANFTRFLTLFEVTGFSPVSGEYAQAQYLRAALGVPGSDYSGTAFKPGTERRTQEEHSACSVSSKLRFRYRPLRYGQNSPFRNRTLEQSSRYQH